MCAKGLTVAPAIMMSPLTLPPFLSIAPRRRREGEGEKGRASHRKLLGTVAMREQVRFWSLLVEIVLPTLGDCQKCLGQAERELVAIGGGSRAGPPYMHGLSPLGSKTAFLAVTVAS